MNCRKHFNCRSHRAIKKIIRQNQIEKIVRLYESDENRTIVIKDESALSVILKYAERVIFVVSKICMWIILCIIFSCGVNAVTNRQIREIIVGQILGGM